MDSIEAVLWITGIVLLVLFGATLVKWVNRCKKCGCWWTETEKHRNEKSFFPGSYAVSLVEKCAECGHTKFIDARTEGLRY